MVDFSDWRDLVYGASIDPEVGQRLGIQFMRASQPIIEVIYNGETVQYHQESMGIMAISGVVWDAGLLLVDFLVHSSLLDVNDTRKIELGYTLDIGCGTGIAGVSALILGSPFALFTDIDRLNAFELNIEELSPQLQCKQKFVSYKWNDGDIPVAFKVHPTKSCPPAQCYEAESDSNSTLESLKLSEVEQEVMVWDTLLCSDLLYEEKSHQHLLGLLRQLQFKKAVFSYKKRHNVPEQQFFEKLSEWCSIHVVDLSMIQLVNLPKTSVSNLYIIVVEPITRI